MLPLFEYFQYIPVELYTFLITFIEEVFPPLPLGVMLVFAGTLARQQMQSVYFVVWIIILSALGKLFSGWLLYYIADKAEDAIVIKFGKYLGVTHKDIENIGNRLTGRWKDWVIMLTLRFIPFFPSTPISVGAGVIHMPLKLYLVTTFIGSLLRNTLFIYAGYQGSILVNIDDLAIRPQDFIISGIVMPVIIGIIGIWYIQKRRK